jgi:hypothetical protein
MRTGVDGVDVAQLTKAALKINNNKRVTLFGMFNLPPSFRANAEVKLPRSDRF